MCVTDTSATQARRGKDIQGIPWERLNITREKYRQTRIEQYKNYENVPSSGEVVDKKHPGSMLEGFTQTQISTLAVKNNLLVAGGFQGEVTCKVVASLVGHLDYSFATAWHPNGHILATCNQDKTCRVWDTRYLASPVAVLKGNLGAIRSIRFSSDGKFMAVAEPADFVHIYNTTLDYKKRQEIDFFGEISWISLSPDDESLFEELVKEKCGQEGQNKVNYVLNSLELESQLGLVL
ncbi:hypothetical protein IFM89_011134 [Coptis chinensis]|uniref:Uncharacterized protein n=1 Tax=Coptis chinensis TaxID=261450 RepID=A0A835HH80_9MAGN|nr:hypothetical protein IFM89_011134 [Coptis chinensis]